MSQWLPGASVVNLSNSRGNGPFGSNGPFLGVILHVNVSGKGSNGTPVDYFRTNPYEVCPNFQVYKDGSTVQFLPIDWQPWCQVQGNFQYAAIETGGDPDEALTDAQLASCARIVRAYHDQMGMVYAVADQPGQKGIGTHQMGGAAWGGHSCPGTIRAGQRGRILELARNPGGLSMSDVQKILDAQAALEAKVDALTQSFDERFSDSAGKPHRLRTWLGWAQGKGALDAPDDVLAEEGGTQHPTPGGHK